MWLPRETQATESTGPSATDARAFCREKSDEILFEEENESFSCQPDFKFPQTDEEEEQRHARQDQRLFPDHLQSHAFDHDRFDDDEKPAGRNSIRNHTKWG